MAADQRYQEKPACTRKTKSRVDWVKMRTDLYRDPKISMMADSLIDADSPLSRYVNQNLQCDMTVTRNVLRNAAVGALVTVWGVTRHRGKRYGDDLVIANCVKGFIDDIADIDGFGDAMEAAGWLVETEDSVIFPRFFEEFNFDPSWQADSTNSQRQARHRAKKKAEATEVSNGESNALRNAKITPREEKRREEIDPIDKGDPLPLLAKDRAALIMNFWAGNEKEFDADLEAARDNRRRHGDYLTDSTKAAAFMRGWFRNKARYQAKPAGNANGAQTKAAASKERETKILEAWGVKDFEDLADNG